MYVLTAWEWIELVVKLLGFRYLGIDNKLQLLVWAREILHKIIVVAKEHPICHTNVPIIRDSIQMKNLLQEWNSRSN
jgi:hypothetical protein